VKLLLAAACLSLTGCISLPLPAVTQWQNIPMIKLTYTYRF
jgi:starvation-inducible outer membrane lipoprotein